MDSIKIKKALLYGFIVLAGATSNVATAIELGGFVQTNTAATNIDDTKCTAGTECELPFNNQRIQLRAENRNDSGSMSFYSKVDLLNDSALKTSASDVREIYLDFNFDSIALRAGRQIITWGVGDLLFINDIFTKNWVAFFSGQPLEYLKQGNDAAKLDFFLGSTIVEIIANDFRADHLPGPRQFVFTNLFSATIVEPTDREVAMKISDNINGWDTAVYASRGFYHQPAFNGEYPKLNTAGVSVSGAFLDGVLNLEAGYYDSVEDRQGTDPNIENSQARLLFGYTQQIGQDTQIGAQLYGEWMQDYDDYKANLLSGHPLRDEVRSVMTLRFTQHYFYQTLTLNLFAFWGISDEDSYVIPSVKYAFSDELWTELGFNIFSGEATGEFGRFDENDNVYLNIRYSF